MDSDRALVERFQQGQSEVFGELYDRYVRKIYDFIYFRTNHRETAEDLASATFMKALEALPKFNPAKGTFQAWLYRIARNTVIDFYRTRKDHAELDQAGDKSSSRDMAHELDIKQLLWKVETYFSRLTDEQRDIVLMRVYSDLSYKEIADILGKTEASCKMSFSRTIAAMRQEVALVIVFALISIFNR